MVLVLMVKCCECTVSWWCAPGRVALRYQGAFQAPFLCCLNSITCKCHAGVHGECMVLVLMVKCCECIVNWWCAAGCIALRYQGAFQAPFLRCLNSITCKCHAGVNGECMVLVPMVKCCECSMNWWCAARCQTLRSQGAFQAPFLL